ncbi:hypothetical protein P8452_42335 [Trifolium repens]|nr:hypothetical protein P8452_42335 [Trifolium repens]
MTDGNANSEIPERVVCLLLHIGISNHPTNKLKIYLLFQLFGHIPKLWFQISISLPSFSSSTTISISSFHFPLLVKTIQSIKILNIKFQIIQFERLY